MKYLTTFLICFLSVSCAYAQQELSLHFLKDIAQANLTNPAFVSSQKTQIILPSVYYNLYTPDFTVKNLFSLNSYGVRDLNEVAKTTLLNRNRISTNINITTLGYAFMKTPKLRISIDHSYHADVMADIDGVLIKAITNDYEKSIGKAIPFDSKLQGSFYHQLSIGGAYQYKENISFGARFKVLKGITNVFTRSAQSTVTINGYNYATTYVNNIDILGFSINSVKSLATIRGLAKQSLNLQNLGVGLDLGCSYKIAKWQLSASMIDALSIINWRKNGKNYRGIGQRRFVGVGNIDIFQTTASFNIKDTLKNIVGLDVLDNAHYVQKLPTKIYLSALYQLDDKWQLGALFYNESGGKLGSYTDFMLNASYKIIENIDIGSSWSIRNKRFDNFGFHLIAQYDKFQLYAVTDNIISVFKPYNFKSSNVRLGLNLVLK